MEGDLLQDDVSIPFPWDKICITNSKTAIKYQIVVSVFKFVVSFEDSFFTAISCKKTFSKMTANCSFSKGLEQYSFRTFFGTGVSQNILFIIMEHSNHIGI